MPEKRGWGRPAGRTAADPPPSVPDESEHDASLSESQLARLRLRQRWEFASVLNFFHVFKECMDGDMEFSAEEIETALITPNDDLAQIHINLLKGISYVSKNLNADAWVKVVCKKLATWWPWVSEGENPLKADHGDEIARYIQLDPTTRLLILKSLCEVRAAQDDISKYITDALKNGTPISAFRKERICSDDGITYWCDGDPVVGYRLYREITGADFKQKLKGKGRSAQPTIAFRWDTLATNLEEFRELSENLSSSKIMSEVAVEKIIKTEILPDLEKLEKKKERALKRQKTQALILDGFMNSSGMGTTHSRRERKPVNYTFDEYDRSIEEAIQISKNPKMIRSNEDTDRQVDHGLSNQDAILNRNMDSDKGDASPDEILGNLREVDDDDKHRGCAGDDDEDDDYDENDDHEGSDSDHNEDDFGDSDEEEDGFSRQKHAGVGRNQKNVKAKVVAGLRRSRRAAATTNGTDLGAYHTEAKGHADLKKRLRQRPTRNADYSIQIPSDSEDESSSEGNKQTELFPGSESEPPASSTATASDVPQDCSDDGSGSDGYSDDDD